MRQANAHSASFHSSKNFSCSVLLAQLQVKTPDAQSTVSYNAPSSEGNRARAAGSLPHLLLLPPSRVEAAAAACECGCVWRRHAALGVTRDERMVSSLVGGCAKIIRREGDQVFGDCGTQKENSLCIHASSGRLVIYPEEVKYSDVKGCRSQLPRLDDSYFWHSLTMIITILNDFGFRVAFESPLISM